MFNFGGRTVVVTGGGSGIGLEIAKVFAQCQAHVIVLDYNETSLHKAGEWFTEQGYKYELYRADISQEEEILGCFESIKGKYAGIDVLVNSAGVTLTKPSVYVTAEKWDRVMNINLRGLFICCKEAAKIMKAKNKGNIINISSQLGIIGMAQKAAYTSSKAAVIHLTRTKRMGNIRRSH